MLVYGFYGHGNAGDELFQEAFVQLFPELDFTFTNELTVAAVTTVNDVWFGGGSFLYDEPIGDIDVIELLKTKRICYISVGLETEIHIIHRELLAHASLIFARSSVIFDAVHLPIGRIEIMPDVTHVFDPPSMLSKSSAPGSVLVIPSFEVVPSWTDPHWKHVHHESFKIEMAQALDELIDRGFIIEFFPMCRNDSVNDDWAAIELLNRMKTRERIRRLDAVSGSVELLTLFSRYETIITQRYHGIVLAEILGARCIAIQHHDKLKHAQPFHGVGIDYYSMTKEAVLNAIDHTNEVMPSYDRTASKLVLASMRKRVMTTLAP